MERKHITITVFSCLVTLLIFRLLQIETPIVPVVNFNTKILAITSQQLAHTGDLIVTERWARPIKKALKLSLSDLVIVEDISELKKELKQSGGIALIPWTDIDPELRVIRLDDKYFWDDPRQFPLKIKAMRLFSGLKKVSPKKVTNITVGGTVVLSRGIGSIIDRTSQIEYPWKEIAGFFKKADLAIVNFKSPLVYTYLKPTSKWQLYGMAKFAKGLSYSGIDLVSIAGNHIGDAGVRGILDTMDILAKQNVKYAGAGKTPDEAFKPIIVKLPNLKIGFIALNSVGNSKYSDPKKGNITIASLTEPELTKLIQELRPSVDIIIAMPNWGDEYVSTPNALQQKWGNFLIDQGVDIVAGDQAHWVQQAKFYRKGFISYGLGNLIFDQTWSKETREGLVERFFFYGKELRSIDLMPVYLNDNWYTEIAREEKNINSVLQKVLD